MVHSSKHLDRLSDILLLRVIALVADNELRLQEPRSPKGINKKAKWGGRRPCPLHMRGKTTRRLGETMPITSNFIASFVNRRQDPKDHDVERARTFRAVLGKTGKLAPSSSLLAVEASSKVMRGRSKSKITCLSEECASRPF